MKNLITKYDVGLVTGLALFYAASVLVEKIPFWAYFIVAILFLRFMRYLSKFAPA